MAEIQKKPKEVDAAEFGAMAGKLGEKLTPEQRERFLYIMRGAALAGEPAAAPDENKAG